MLKYLNTQVTFLEVPNEITLCINITGCKIGCKGCHSSYLAEDIGTILDSSELESLIKKNNGITCVAFMGGDSDSSEINNLAKWIQIFMHHKYKVAWYSGRQELSKDINLKWFDFVKLGPYKEEYGPLNSKSTNQRMYKVVTDNYEDGTSGYELVDITNKFWK